MCYLWPFQMFMLLCEDGGDFRVEDYFSCGGVGSTGCFLWNPGGVDVAGQALGLISKEWDVWAQNF